LISQFTEEDRAFCCFREAIRTVLEKMVGGENYFKEMSEARQYCRRLIGADSEKDVLRLFLNGC